MSGDERRITEIIDRLDALTIEASDLTGELRDLRRRTRAAQREVPARTRTAQREVPRERSVTTFEHGFEVDDQVVITNLYQGFRGTRGTVTGITSQFVTLRDANGRSYTRKCTNLRKVTNRAQV